MGSHFILIVFCIITSLLVQLIADNYNFDEEMNSILFGGYVPSRRAEPVYTLKKSDFQMLENYYLAATPASESKYPWIAKVVHSTTGDYPMLCTATCIEERIFITSGRCLGFYNTRVSLTRVIYKNTRLPAKAFVLSTHHSKQWYDDIGIIIVENGYFKGPWATVKIGPAKISRRPKKTPNNEFKWFEDQNFDNQTKEHTAIAYAYEKFTHKVKHPTLPLRLVELKVSIGIKMCEKFYKMSLNYHVPCYNYCSLTEIKTLGSSACNKTLSAEGAAVYNTKTKELLGIATWGTQTSNVDFPVGFSVPNSDDFIENLACAKKIRGDNKVNPPKGYFQSLCPKK